MSHDDARYMAAMMLVFMSLALVMQVLVMRLKAAASWVQTEVGPTAW
ncbi:MAG: hypothetical protein IPM80_07365 [Proteobacteria bacterium]|nr:hypothetical protein [Pseudomonadota bacterium]